MENGAPAALTERRCSLSARALKRAARALEDGVRPERLKKVAQNIGGFSFARITMILERID
jgi:hypothetical protein